MKTTPSSPDMPRRTFLKNSSGIALGMALGSTGILTAAERGRPVGANDRIRIGIIGCGGRGQNVHMEAVHTNAAAMNLEIVALCDPWRVAREQANAKVRSWFGRDARLCASHRELLELPDVDAVMIASPDHLHTAQLEAAADVGKHIYVEKPIAMDMGKLVSAVDAVKAAGTVVQVGTQLRSIPAIVGAREVYRSGILGKFSRIEECRNEQVPYWYNKINDNIRAEDVDWQEFLGDRPDRPFDSRVFSAWWGYYEFSQGPIPQLGTHFIDMVHFIADTGLPETCVCLGGKFASMQDGNFTVPDCVQATWTYPEGFLLSSANNFGNGAGNTRKFYADKGVLKVDNWNAPVYTAEGGPNRDGSIRGVVSVPPVEGPDHFQNWFECMRTGATPHASIDVGYQQAVATLMAVQSYETGQRTVYDPDKRVIRAG